MLVSGLWQNSFIETRRKGYINDYNFSYNLNKDLDTAKVYFEIKCDETVNITVYDMENNVVYDGTEQEFEINNIKLWWCSGQGDQYLYHYKLSTESDEKTGNIGFKKVELLMNENSWDEPKVFPKTRSTPPAVISLNGRKIFAKGSNFVRPELFPGTTSKETYLPLLELIKEANMNIVRNWGGSEIYKESFYDICDELGIMVWQEFPLACLSYPNDENYLSVLEQEATAIICRLKKHVCLTIWCGGNELFNSWSGMTDQAHPLRLLNSLCYNFDRNTPFLMTSPLYGMAHGGYTFVDLTSGKDVFQEFNEANNTAYTEFGVPSIASYEYLKTFIPKEEINKLKPNSSWEKHHAFKAWDQNSWLHPEMIKKYFGKSNNIEELSKRSNIMQCEGYHAIFEEARRQWPRCSMAINWCFNEPWPTVANNSIVNYPTVKKAAYEAVKNSLRDCMPSARITKFDWVEGEFFSSELWMLNSSPNSINDCIKAYLIVDEKKIELITWNDIKVDANSNLRGPSVGIILPHTDTKMFVLRLESKEEVWSGII